MMIELNYGTTPNGHKITIFLEEAGAPYQIVPVNIFKGAPFGAEFLRISPNNRIPAIVDTAPADGGAGPAVVRAYEVAKAVNTAPAVSEAARAHLFGQVAR